MSFKLLVGLFTSVCVAASCKTSTVSTSAVQADERNESPFVADVCDGVVTKTSDSSLRDATSLFWTNLDANPRKVGVFPPDGWLRIQMLEASLKNGIPICTKTESGVIKAVEFGSAQLPNKQPNENKAKKVYAEDSVKRLEVNRNGIAILLYSGEVFVLPYEPGMGEQQLKAVRQKLDALIDSFSSGKGVKDILPRKSAKPADYY